MKESDILREQYEDSLFSLLMKRHAEIEGEVLLQQNRELNVDESAAVPEEIAESGRRVIRKTLAENNRKSAGKHFGKFFLRFAIAAIITVSLVGAALSVSASLRLSAMNLLIKMDPKMASWAIGKEENEGKISIVATWVPSGYHVVDNQSDEMWAELVYENNNGNKIFVFVGAADCVLYEINLENSVSQEIRVIQSSDAIFTNTDGLIKLSWFDEKNNLSIECEAQALSEAELIYFADNLVIS